MNIKTKELGPRQTEIAMKQIGCKLSDFEILSELGRGSFGVVFKVKSIVDGNIYVIKRLDLKHMKEKAQKEAWKEAMILKKLNHPNIIRYFVSFLEEENLYIVMEYAEGGDLYSILKSYKKKGKLFSEEELWRFAYEILIGLEYLHCNNIIHRDIKCLNIFLTKEKIIKIGDLGVSKIVANLDALICSRVGTPLYLSPELIKQQPYDFKVDLWALGCTLFHLATLEPPFTGDNLIVLGNNIVKTKQKPLSNQFSSNFIKSVEGLLNKNPENRPSIKSLLDLVPINIKDEYHRKLKNHLQNIDNHKDDKKRNTNEKVIMNDNKKFDMNIEDEKNKNDKIQSNSLKKLEEEKSENKPSSTNNNLVKIHNPNNLSSQTKNIAPAIHEVKGNFSNLLLELKNELPSTINDNLVPKLSNRAPNLKDIGSDQASSRKTSFLIVKKDLNSPVKLTTNSISLKKDGESFFPHDNKFLRKETFPSKNRIFSSKIRKSVGKKNDVRPNTASMNKNIVPIKTKREEFNTEVAKHLRPMTAIEKVKDGDEKIINININFFNLDINRKYFEPKSTKSLLYINENIFKTDHDCPPLDEIKKLSYNKLENSNRITSAKVPKTLPIYQSEIKASEYFIRNRDLDSKKSQAKQSLNQGKIEIKQSINEAVFNKLLKQNSSKNDFIFKSILSKIETVQERKILTINDFK